MRKIFPVIVLLIFSISPALAGEQGNVIVKRAYLNFEAMNVKNLYVHNLPEITFYLRNNGSISAVIINATLTYDSTEAIPTLIPSAIPSGYISMMSFAFADKISCDELQTPIQLTLSVYYYATESEIQLFTHQTTVTPEDPYEDLLIIPDLQWTLSRDQSGSHYSTPVGIQYAMEIGKDYSLSYSLINSGREELNYRMNVSYDPNYLFIISSNPESSYQRSELPSTTFSLAGGGATPWKHSITPISAGDSQIKIKIEDLTDGGCANLNKEITLSVTVSVPPGPFGMYITRGLDMLDLLLILCLAILILVKFYKKAGAK